jgi:hypothetical protein
MLYYYDTATQCSGNEQQHKAESHVAVAPAAHGRMVLRRHVSPK